MKTQLVKILFALLALCLSTTVFTKNTDYYTTYSGYPAMMERLKENCNNYSKSLHFEKLLEANRKKKISRVTEFFSFEHVVSLTSFDGEKCNYALAQNTIEGMSFILANRPKSSFMHNDANKAIAKALLIQWALEPSDSKKAFEKAKNYADTFLAQDDDSYKSGESYASYFLSNDIIDVAESIERKIKQQYPERTEIKVLYANNQNSKVLTLYQLAADYAHRGFDKAIDKNQITASLSKSLIALAERYPSDSKEQTDVLHELDQLIGFKMVDIEAVAKIYNERNDFEHMKYWIVALKPVSAFNCSLLTYFDSDLKNPLSPEQFIWFKDFMQQNCTK